VIRRCRSPHTVAACGGTAASSFLEPLSPVLDTVGSKGLTPRARAFDIVWHLQIVASAVDDLVGRPLVTIYVERTAGRSLGVIACSHASYLFVGPARAARLHRCQPYAISLFALL